MTGIHCQRYDKGAYMSSCSVQFHALNEELFSFIEELRTDNELFVFCSDDLRLREYSIINPDSKVEITKNRRIFFLRRIIDECEVQGSNSLIVYCGHQNDNGLQQSYMEINGDGDPFAFWKRIITKYKKKLLKGATIYTPDKENMAYYRNTYYTESAQNEYRRGMKMKALAGGCYYDLESKVPGQ